MTTISPLAPGMLGIDSASAHPDPAKTHAAGGRFVLRYSAGVGNTSPRSQWKLCGPHEIAEAVAAGNDFIANSEWYEDRVTEGKSAGAADGAADLIFWKSRGYSRGSTIYCSWDAWPDPKKFGDVADYLKAYRKALGGYYDVDLYAGTPALRYLMKWRITGRVITKGWRPNAGSWSDDGLPYQPSTGNIAVRLRLVARAQQVTPAAIWQTGNYWFDKGADENLILRVPVGSHLEALTASQPKPKPTKPVTPPAQPVATVQEDDMASIIHVDETECRKLKVRWPGYFTTDGVSLAHIASPADLKVFRGLGMKEATAPISVAQFKALGGTVTAAA